MIHRFSNSRSFPRSSASLRLANKGRKRDACATSRRRGHSLDAARIEIPGAFFVHELDDDAIDTTLIAQSVRAMASLRNDDMTAVWQILRNFLASLRRRDRIHGAGKYQHRNIRRDGIVIIGRYFSLRPYTAGAGLLKDTVVSERISLVQLRGFRLVDERNVLSTGHREIHSVCDGVRDRLRNRFMEEWPEITLGGLMNDKWNPSRLVPAIHPCPHFLRKNIALNLHRNRSAFVGRRVQDARRFAS